MRDIRGALDALAAIAQASQGETPLRQLFDRLCRAVAVELGFDRAMLARYNPRTGTVVPVTIYGDTEEGAPGPIPLTEIPMLQQAAETHDVVYVERVRIGDDLPRYLVERYGVTSLVAVPLYAGGELIGFLSTDHSGAPFKLDDLELATLETAGIIAGTLLEKEILRRQAQRLTEARNQFISVAAHELRTPLTAIYGLAVTLDERADELSRDRLLEMRHALREQADRMSNLIEQLLDLSRLDVGAVTLHPQPLAIGPAVEETVELVAANDLGEVEIEIPRELVAVVDETALARIVGNLVANAISYGEPPVTIHAEQRDRHLRLSVEDRGAGIDPAFAPRIFDRFTRGVRNNAGKGSGLGLAIARAYADAHGGTLIYEPARPSGARFELVLPLRPPDAN
jgi:signal transduction histidine kinase